MCIYEQKIWIEHLAREDIQIANKQIKRNVQHHQLPRKCNLNQNEILFCSYQVAKVKNGDNTKCWQGCRKTGSLVHYLWEYKMIWPLWDTTWKFFYKIKHAITSWPCNCTFGALSQRNKSIRAHKQLYTDVHNSFICNSPKLQPAQMSLPHTMEHCSAKKWINYWYTQYWVWVGGNGCGCKRAMWGILVVLELFNILMMVVDMQTYTCDKLYRITHTSISKTGGICVDCRL